MISPDRNKTLSTRKVTTAVLVWMDNLGFKPVETEVQLRGGWQCDIAGVLDPTRSEAVQMKLIPRKASWRDWESNAVAGEQKASAHELAYSALPSPITALVEVKTTLSDLKSDLKWLDSSPADLSFLAIPEKLVESARSLVTNLEWGLIRVTERGCRIIRWPIIAPTTVEQRVATIYSIALKRDHGTRYAALRESQKQARVIRNQEKVTPDRWAAIARAVSIIVSGGRAGVFVYSSVEHVLNSQRIGYLPSSVLEQLAELWGAAVPNGMPEQEASVFLKDYSGIRR